MHHLCFDLVPVCLIASSVNRISLNSLTSFWAIADMLGLVQARGIHVNMK